MQDVAVYGHEPLHVMRCCVLQRFLTLEPESLAETPFWSGLQIGKGLGPHLIY